MKATCLVALLIVCVAHPAIGDDFLMDTFFGVQKVIEENPYSCADAMAQGFTENGDHVIDPDGPEGEAPITVYCDMSGDQGISIVHHNVEYENREDRKIDNCEDPGSCVVDVQYKGSMAQVRALADLSGYCEQFVRYTAYASVMWWPPEDQSYGWWQNRDGKKMTNWGGAPTGTTGCGCSVKSGGCKENKQCNADCNTHQETDDSGFLNDKSNLPVSSLRFGDTGTADDDEYGYYELGPLRCKGGPTSVEREIPIFDTNTDYRYRYDLAPFKPGECYVEFEVKACHDVFLGFSTVEGEQSDLIELNIGGWGNSKTVFRNCKQCTAESEYLDNVLNCDEMRGFWVSLCDGCFRFGRQGAGQSLSWCPPRPVDWKYMAYSTGYGSVGTFKFDSFYAKEMHTCEHEVAYINCGTRYINVISASYGRSSRDICQEEHMKSASCSSAKSLSVVGKLCHGRQQCQVMVNNGVFGDPCSGTYKYLHVKYQCLEERRKKEFTPYGCINHKCNLKGGECVPVHSSDYRCSCKTGFQGEFCENEYAMCRAWGDPHYTQFSGRNFNYQGKCKYILAQPCVEGGEKYFKIVGVNVEPSWNDDVSFNRQLEVQIGNTEIFLLQNKHVLIDNNIMNVPCGTGQDIKLEMDGKYVIVSSASYGVKIFWDGVETYKILVDRAIYGENICGLCGSIKPHTEGIFIMRNGQETTSIQEFGDSWTANPLVCPSCDNCISLSHCENDENLFNRVMTACGPIVDRNGVFAVGHEQFRPEAMFDTCVFDMCSRKDFDDGIRCNNLEEYANRILLENRLNYLQDGNQIVNWREIYECSFSCPKGSVYSICASSCQRTCYQPVAPTICEMNCVEGCELLAGFVMENDVPIAETSCGCRYDNKYYQVDEKWINSDCSESCACEAGGQVICNPVACTQHAFCGSQNQIHNCHCEPNYIGDGCNRCQMPCPSNMGNAIKLRANVDEGYHAIIDFSRPISCEGYIKSFSIKRNTDSIEQVTLIIWRQHPVDESKFIIVGSALLGITDDSLNLCTCDHSKIPVRAGDYIGFMSFGGTVFYDDESDPDAGNVLAAPYFDSVEPMKEVQFAWVDGARAYSINIDLESSDGKRVEPFMFSSYLGVQSGRIPNSAMSASSFRGDYLPNRGRLDNTNYGSCAWTAEITNKEQWLQVDLAQETVVIGVVSQGHCGIEDQEGSPMGCVKQFHVQYSGDGTNFEYATDDNDNPDVFDGICSCQKHVRNFFRYAVMTRFIRFRPITWRSAISMRVDIIGRDIATEETRDEEALVPGQSLDDTNTAVVFTGTPFKRDGFLKGLKYLPLSKASFTMAVLRETDTQNTFSLVGSTHVTSSGEDKMQTFEIEDSEQIPVRAGDFLCLLFQDAVIGYDDDDAASSDVMITSLGPEEFKRIALASKISFTTPARRQYHGVRAKFQVATTRSIPPVMSTCGMGLAKGQVKDEQITASSYCDSSSKANRVRLGLKDQQGMTGGWCAKERDQTGFVQVDFGAPMRCGGVVTQGLSSTSRLWFVQKYIVKCSVDMATWMDVADNDGNTVMFSGNYDQESEVENYFSAVLFCRAIQIIPMMWVGEFPAMRLDVLGLPEVTTVEREVGFSCIRREYKGSGGFTFVMPEKQFETDGFVTGVRFLPRQRGSFTVMIFRPLDVAALQYKVVGMRKIKVKKDDVEVEVKFNQNKKNKNKNWISVKEGDMLGLSFITSVLYKSKEGEDVTKLVYSKNSAISNFRKLRAGQTVTFAAEVQRSYSLVVLFKPKGVGEVVSSVDAQKPLGLENGQFRTDAITVSSTYVSETPGHDFGPQSCRLKFVGTHDGAWVPAEGDAESWIQVDTESDSVFTGLITQGRHGLLNWWVTKYRVSYSKDGATWLDVQDCADNQATFEANTDSDTEVTRYFCNAINGRYLRIYLLEWMDRPALRFEVLGGFETAATEYGPSCIDRVNLDSKNYILLAAGIPFQSDGYVTEWKFFPNSDRPFRAGVWRVDPDDPLRYKHIGSSDIPGQTILELAIYRLDDLARIPFRKGDVMGWSFADAVIPFDEGEESIELLYSGNGGILDPTPVGAYRKFYSSGKQAYSIGASVSITTVQSVPAVACQHGLGMDDDLIPDQAIETSSLLGPQYANSQVRLNAEASATLKGCWAPAKNEKDQYVQVDLGKPTLVTGVGVQGCSEEKRWVTKFRVQFSNDLKNWKMATDKHGSEIFYGNTDSDTVVKVFFSAGHKTQFVRVLVEEWNSDIGLRFEVLGCPTVCETEWGASPLVRRWKYSQCDKTFVVNTENPLTCNSYIKGWRMVPRVRASVTFYVLKPVNIEKGEFKVVGKTHVPSSRDMVEEEVYEIVLERSDWIEVRSGYMIGFSSRRGSPIYKDRKAHDKAEYMVTKNKDIKNVNRLDVGDKVQMEKFQNKEATYSFSTILTQEGVGESKDTVPSISCSGGLGMESGGIPDESIIASSSRDVLQEGAAQARLMGNAAWSVSQLDEAPFIQVNFGYTARLTGISTQGDPANEAWVTSFALEYSAFCNYISKEPVNFEWMKFTNSLKDIFAGNVDQNSVKTNFFKQEIEALVIRLSVLEFHNHASMRLEFLGCPNSDPCDPSPCKNGALCRKTQASLGYSCNCPMEWGGKNCEIKTHKCCAYGDPHYCNFDGLKFGFQGNCEYILARTIQESARDHFEITADNIQSARRSTVSITREVYVRIGDKKFDFKQNREVFVNKERINCPYGKDGISVIDGSNGRVVLKTEFGLIVSWDGKNKVDIHLTEDYKNEVEGLCGNYNGQQGDDYIIRASGDQTTNMNVFGESWGADPTCDACLDCEEQDECRRIDKIDEAQAACSILINPHGPFAMCQLVIDPQPFYASCMFDFCAIYPLQDNLCGDIQSYAEECIETQIQVGNWRKPGFCAVDCPTGMIQSQIGTLCPNSCGDQNAADDCTGQSGPMCECMPGLLLEDGSRCVPEAECGCTYQGEYHKKGDQKFMADVCNEICSCDQDHNAICVEVSCNDHAECKVQEGIRGCFCSEGWTGDGMEFCDEILDPQVLVICEEEVLNIDCSVSSERIEILEVEYSTQVRDECPNTANNQELESHRYAKTIIRNRCHNQGQCSVSVSTRTFGSFADDIWKALYVKYQCRESVAIAICIPDVELLSCQGSPLEIDCGYFKVDVIHAEFGRRQGDQTCSAEENEVLSENCFTSLAFHNMLELCHTNSMCSIDTVPDTFGVDPCPATSKYLRIHYRCDPNPDPKVIEDDKCEPNPCVNGICEAVSIEPKYNCKCDAGFTGQHCDIGMATCKALGDPHYITFDNKDYDFMGHCKYTLVKNADADVPDFEVVVYNEAARRNPSMSSTVQVEFHYSDHVINLKYGGETTMDGVKIEGLTKEHLKINVNYPEVVIQTNIGVEIRWDGKFMVEVDVTGNYFGHTEGLCGTYNSNPDDDYLTRYGETLEDPVRFGRSWFVPGDDGCEDCEDCELPEPCNDAGIKDAAQEICNNLISPTGPFQECHAVVSPSFYYQSCVTDRCVMPDGLAHCEDYHAYAEKCKEFNIIINWRRQDFCYIDCFAKEMIYSPSSPSCPTTCANPFASSSCNQVDKEDCICPTGMIKEGETCIEVEKCGCVDDISGIYYKQGESFMTMDCSSVCTCQDQILQCIVFHCSPHEVCGARDGAPVCLCDEGYFRDAESNTCEAIPVPQILVRPQMLLECTTISCGAGFVNILEATFGPRVDEICLEAGDPDSCNAVQTLDILRNLCQGRAECVLDEETVHSLGEPCFDALNYIYVKFSCTHKPIAHDVAEDQSFSLRVCQDRSLALVCALDQDIQISEVFLGRRANDQYCLDRGSVAPGEDMSDPTAMSEAIALCGSKSFCFLSANYFADSSAESKEYLEVVYSCIPKITPE